MKTLEKGQDKIKQICDLLRKDTLEPAKREAGDVVAEANAKSDKIISAANLEADRIVGSARETITQERRVFQSALVQASKQSMEELKQLITKELFDEELYNNVVGVSKKPNVVADLISAIVKALERDGIDTDLSAVIPNTVSSEEINVLLGEGIVKRLKAKGVNVGEFDGGAMVRLHGKRLILDISSNALTDLMGRYLRKDFREILFKS